MFVLITGICEVIGSETKVQVFGTHKEAHDEMVRQARERALELWPSENPDDGIDCIEDDGAFILDVCGWQIRELPGVLIDGKTADFMRSSLAEMHRIYADDDRTDYFDADDIAIGIACKVETYL